LASTDFSYSFSLLQVDKSGKMRSKLAISGLPLQEFQKHVFGLYIWALVLEREKEGERGREI
jgi:hypothetical protein